MGKDWTGNANSIYKIIGASNHTVEERQVDDYYATDPIALEMLLEKETFNPYVWECACGGGHLSKVLIDNGYKVKSSDIVYRGFEDAQIIDFLKVQKEDIKNDFSRDIITNPPYKYAKEFVEKALEISSDGVKVAMFLKLTFLEGTARYEMFKNIRLKKYMYLASVLIVVKTEYLPAPRRSVTPGLFGRKDTPVNRLYRG